jgi:ATP-dependent Clp protease protease subunit
MHTNPPLRPSPWQPTPQAPPGPVAPSVVTPLGAATGEWLHEHLLARRIVLARGHLDHDLATLLCAQLLTLDAEGDDPIELHLSTPDADLDAAVTLLDAMAALRVPVHALAVGTVGGAAVAVFAAARRRTAFPHATFVLREPQVRAHGSATELAAAQERVESLLAAVYERLAATTGRAVDELRADARRGRFLTADDAREYGLLTEDG